MSMTVKQLADNLGVSKTCVRKRFTPEFKEKHTQTIANGLIVVDDEGCKLIAENVQASRLPLLPEPLQTPEQIALDVLREQISVKDTQIAVLQEQVSQLTASLKSSTESLSTILAIQRDKTYIKERQRQGIDAMHIVNGKRVSNNPKKGAVGRPPATYPKNWESLYQDWKAGKITATKAMELLNLKRTTFYRLVQRYESK